MGLADKVELNPKKFWNSHSCKKSHRLLLAIRRDLPDADSVSKPTIFTQFLIMLIMNLHLVAM